VEPPTLDPSDSLIAYGAESGLFMAEEAKSTSTPKCFRHIISFAFLEVSFTGRIVRACFALDLDVSFNGRAIDGQQPHLIRCPFVFTCFPEEVPVTPPIPFVGYVRWNARSDRFPPGRQSFQQLSGRNPVGRPIVQNRRISCGPSAISAYLRCKILPCRATRWRKSEIGTAG